LGNSGKRGNNQAYKSLLSQSDLIVEVDMKGKILLLTLCLCLGATAVLSADEIVIKYAWAFKDRYPDIAEKLGFQPGNIFQVGALVTPSDSPIKEVTAKNLDTGLILKASAAPDLNKLFPGIYMVDPMPSFDPSKHKGVWEIRAVDEKGREAVAKTHRMDKDGDMPFVEELKASGDPLAPIISWKAPNEKDIPKGVTVEYRVRLLKDSYNQLYRSESLSNTQHQIPEGKIKSEDLPDIYLRVECSGIDKDDSDHPVALELRSETIKSLKDALGK
jgi:hypothetical protein